MPGATPPSSSSDPDSSSPEATPPAEPPAKAAKSTKKARSKATPKAADATGDAAESSDPTPASSSSDTPETAPGLTDQDLYLFNEGTHLRLYERMGVTPGHRGWPGRRTLRRLGSQCPACLRRR